MSRHEHAVDLAPEGYPPSACLTTPRHTVEPAMKRLPSAVVTRPTSPVILHASLRRCHRRSSRMPTPVARCPTRPPPPIPPSQPSSCLVSRSPLSPGLLARHLGSSRSLALPGPHMSRLTIRPPALPASHAQPDRSGCLLPGPSSDLRGRPQPVVDHIFHLIILFTLPRPPPLQLVPYAA